MPPDTVQIGPLLISKSVFDAILPVLTLFLGGLFGYIGKTFAENRQWKREDQKAAREEARREKEREAETQAKLRQKLHDMYADGVKSLAVLLYEFRESGSNRTSQSEALQAVQKALSAITIEHYDKENPKFKEFYSQYYDMMYNHLDTEAVYELRQMTIDFSLQDPRLKQ
jgi:hypothetical protein